MKCIYQLINYNCFHSVDLFNKNNEKPKTVLELLQEQRDLKRRRAAYRGKRVHSDRKSYVEVSVMKIHTIIQKLSNGKV